MDTLIKYQEAIIALLEEYAAVKPANMPEISHEILADRERNHYALIRLGWNQGKFVYHCVMHFDIIDEKVWLQQNWTDQNLAEELMDKGVAREDIVLGFVPPYARHLSGFAA